MAPMAEQRTRRMTGIRPSAADGRDGEELRFAPVREA
jgi:hypothetical protein